MLHAMRLDEMTIRHRQAKEVAKSIAARLQGTERYAVTESDDAELYLDLNCMGAKEFSKENGYVCAFVFTYYPDKMGGIGNIVSAILDQEVASAKEGHKRDISSWAAWACDRPRCVFRSGRRVCFLCFSNHQRDIARYPDDLVSVRLRRECVFGAENDGWFREITLSWVCNSEPVAAGNLLGMWNLFFSMLE
jgi:hypothetical protein